MTIKADRVVRNPLYADAIQVAANNLAEVAAWCQGDVCPLAVADKWREGSQYVKVKVHHPWTERQTKAFITDWILYSNNSFKVYPDKAFKATWTFVDDDGNIDQPEELMVTDNKEELKHEMGSSKIRVVKPSLDSVVNARLSQESADRAFSSRPNASDYKTFPFDNKE